MSGCIRICPSDRHLPAADDVCVFGRGCAPFFIGSAENLAREKPNAERRMDCIISYAYVRRIMRGDAKEVKED